MPLDPFEKKKGAKLKSSSSDSKTISKNTAGKITIRQVIASSRWYYRNVDNKERRAKMDITSAKIVTINNFTYDVSTRSWKQTGRNLKFQFLVRSRPKSYSAGPPKARAYPVTFLIEDVALGLDSNFRWRTGSLKKPVFLPKGAPKYKNFNSGIINIKNGVQLDFFFNLEWVLKHHNLLYGINWAKRPPKKKNPKKKIYFDKHAWFVMKKILIPLFTSRQSILSRYISNK